VTATLDAFVLEYAPGPVVDLHPAIPRLRDSLSAALATLGQIPDDRLTSHWAWDGSHVDVRYGFYRGLEMIERAAAEVGRAVAAVPSTEARDAMGAATAARWDLDGLLAGLTDDDFDADPGGGEWTIRQTMGHIIGGQRGYAWGSAYWLSLGDQPRVGGPQRAPDELFAAMPTDDQEGEGTFAEVRGRLHDVVDATSSRYATLTGQEMAVMGGWSGFPVTIAFRMWRLPSHIEEHTVQVEKTLAMLGRQPTEVARLVRLISRAYGRLEQEVFGLSADEIGPPVRASSIMDQLSVELNALAPDVRAAADSGVPSPDW